MSPGLADFAGRWRLTRRIEDRAAGTVATFAGRADFTPDGAGLRYDEWGTLSMPGRAPMRAERRYLWRADPQGIAVLFADGRPFHVFDPAGAATARHPCDPDIYDVRYDFAAWPAWQAVWHVTGPRKDYTLTSLYRPAESAVD
ncbi:hypothetical protein SAMN04490244_104220 [Tranquillimonas rosea]|uniref:DUF6314 domain-containing protein n=1 Tax=Tranquillimonas rosea TaxID=641238 RepID=A0A1H9TKT5_9RHOB|nr:DUF6314 family protein [Tranquillimonas rosea]SER97233.1 hypothetical protein SAMN04490244_104220 [Tranquillimonas rosea]